MTDPRPTVRPDLHGTDLAARYGRSGRGRKPLIAALIGVVALGGLVWLVRVALVQANPQVASRLVSFHVTSPTTASATFQVDRRADVEAACRLQAKAKDFSIVGEVTVTVPVTAPRLQTVTTALTTQRQAAAVILVGCTTADSARPH